MTVSDLSPQSPARTPVMADVARLAGVSHQTVSRVVNGQTNLRPATRERVEQAILQLGYRPNTAARALVTRRSATIGVIGSKSGYWGPSTVHRTIQAAGREAGDVGHHRHPLGRWSRGGLGHEFRRVAKRWTTTNASSSAPVMIRIQ